MKNLLMKLNTTSRMVYFFRFLLYVITCMFFLLSSGLRCVKPYYFTFTSHAKGRWVWFNVYDVFCKEFQLFSSNLVPSNSFSPLPLVLPSHAPLSLSLLFPLPLPSFLLSLIPLLSFVSFFLPSFLPIPLSSLPLLLPLSLPLPSPLPIPPPLLP